MFKLVKPAIEYKESFIEALKESHAEGRSSSLIISELEKDFSKLVHKYQDREKGIGLKEGYVPDTRLWLVEGSEYIGWVAIRHSLSESLMKEGGHIGYEIRPTKRKMGYGSKILELALPVALNLGIKEALITCNDDNIASAKIIEKNGGILENKVELGDKLVRRYWIKI